MTTFEFEKPIEDVEAPQLLDEGWYDVRIAEEPKAENNKVARDQGESVPGAGKNIVLRLRTLHDIPEYHGRMLTIWVALPAIGDRTKYTATGQTMEDWKMQNAFDKCHAFGGSPSGKTLDFYKGMLASVYVIQQMAPGRSDPSNSVDINADIGPVSAKGQMIHDALPPDAGDDNIPF